MKGINFETVLTDNAEYALLMDTLKKKIAYFKMLLNKNQMFCF